MFTDGRTDGQTTDGDQAHRYIPEPFGRGIKRLSCRMTPIPGESRFSFSTQLLNFIFKHSARFHLALFGLLRHIFALQKDKNLH